MRLESLDQVQQWSKENLLTRQDAAKITGQSYAAFSQSINLKNIVPFLEFGSGTRTVRLYLKSEIEEYANHLLEKKKKL